MLQHLPSKVIYSIGMGYQEMICQLCSVGFNICRLRRAAEPEEAAWDYNGSGHVCEAFLGEPDVCVGCERLSGNGRNGEHIAGIDCHSTRGYSGHRISVEEMKGCRAIQVLLGKQSDWKPEAGDEDFELEGNYFLSGLGDGSPADLELRHIRPARHGIERALVGNWRELGVP